MENISLISEVLLGLGFLFLLMFRNDKLQKVADYLAAVVFVLFFFSHMGVESTSFTGLALISLTLAYAVSYMKSIANTIWGKLILLLPPVLFVLFGEGFKLGEYVIDTSATSFVGLLGYGLVIPLIIEFKTSLFAKIFGVEEDKLARSLKLFVIGFAAFVGSFFLSWAGVMTVALGVAISSLFMEGKNRQMMYSMFLISLVGSFLNMGEIDTVDLSMGKVMEGLFFGLFIAGFIEIMNTSIKWKVASTLFSVSVSILLIGGILFLGTQKTDLGGIDAFIGIAVGSSLALLFSRSAAVPGFVFLLYILSAHIGIPMSKPENQALDQIEVNTESEVEEVKVYPGIPLDSIIGSYQISQKDLKFDFELGPKGGRTKGAFKEIQGTVEIKADVNSSVFDVQIPVSSLTTFNKFRDESLFGDEYFNVQKFPEISFKGATLKKVSDHYTLKGKFEMLGISGDQEMEIKLIEKDGNSAILQGKGMIDRTKFGMRPDPKEGNLVDFQFVIRLEKK